MKFKKQIFGFMDMLRFKKLVPNRREALANGPTRPCPSPTAPTSWPTPSTPAHGSGADGRAASHRRHARADLPPAGRHRLPLLPGGTVCVPPGQVGESLVSRPYSIASSPREALENKLVLGVENAGFFSGYLDKAPSPATGSA